MRVDRRGFLKIAGLVTLGVASKPLLDAVAAVEGPKALGTSAAVEGAKWAMVIDPRACEEGCRDCIDACHSVHNVPSLDEPKHEIKWVWPAGYEEAFPDQEDHFIGEHVKGLHFTLLCNHCANPPCVRVCPTRATYKREDGIIMMDYHRCIGCRYCMAACPYGSRSFNWVDPRPHIKEVDQSYPTRTKGVVEKCNFCDERLARGLPPACVEACKKGALAFGNLEDAGSEVRSLLSSRFAIQRKPGLGTEPKVYYLI